MFKKELLICALILTFCLGLVGTAMAGSVAFDEAQLEQAAAEQEKMTASEKMSTHDSNVKSENNESKLLLCLGTSGVISNLDHTTAEQDRRQAKLCS